MRLSISRNAAFSAAFVAAVTRVFLNLSLDGDAPHNGIWIAALLGAVPAIPYLLCLDAVRKSSTGVTPVRKALMLILLLITALDAARVLSIFTRASGYLALEFVSPLWLTLPVALAILWCMWRNGDAVGYAAMLWTKVFPALMLVVILLQLRHYHAEWLRPLLGNRNRVGRRCLFGGGTAARAAPDDGACRQVWLAMAFTVGCPAHQWASAALPAIADDNGFFREPVSPADLRMLRCFGAVAAIDTRAERTSVRVDRRHRKCFHRFERLCWHAICVACIPDFSVSGGADRAVSAQTQGVGLPCVKRC